MNLTTVSSSLRPAGLKLPRWDTLPRDSAVFSHSSLELPEESLNLSPVAKDKMVAVEQRLGQLANLSASLTGSQVERVPNHATEERPRTEQSLRERALEAVRQRELATYSHVETALSSGQPTTFQNSAGSEVAYTLRQNKNVGEHASYTLGVGRHSLEVQLPEGTDRVLGLGRVADFFSQQPENLRGAVDTLRVEMGENPSNAYWQKEYNRPDFESAATGGSGTITFYRGLSHLKKRTFNHEFGHNVGEAVRREQDREAKASRRLGAERRLDRETGDSQGSNFPRGYSRALEADHRQVSGYGDSSPGEDFAEFYEAYRAASERGEPSLREFTEQYPHRSQLLQTQVLPRELSTAK